ncbi:TonB-dependent receptor [Limibacter armeniacum]|uniref:SusC/RagA family TonB-linked outer membrane protein n=1 Tax=Limibacter armeniacum TaxID=466084 RepID=UPI002FE617EF
MYQKLRYHGYSTGMKLIATIGALLLSTALMAQTKVTGTISTEAGEPLPGVNIMIEGTTKGVISDLDGRYSVLVSEGESVLVVSYIGYVTQKIEINGRSAINVSLAEDMEALEEVVVVGYGTVKKKDLTGSVAGVDAAVLAERGTTSPIQALQGSVAGVQINNSTGRVGDGFNLTIRGKNTVNSSANAPLYVVDGVITDGIDFLNPQDIAKIDILKDASSAAIYGSRGSNGVVLITTKSGASIPSGTTVSFDTFYGTKNPARLPKMMSPEKWKYYHMSAYLATNYSEGMTSEEFYDKVVSPSKNAVLRERMDNNDGYDWYDAVLKPGMQSNSYLSITHRNGRSSYTLGAGYQQETGNIENEGLEKFTLRSSIDQEMSDRLKVGGSFAISLSNIERGSKDAMRDAFRLNPFLSPWAIDENGNEIEGEYYAQPGKLQYPDGTSAADKTSTYNPLLQIDNSSDETRQWNLLGNIYAQYDILDWINVKSALSTGLKTYRRGEFWGVLTEVGANNNDLASSAMTNYENFNLTWDNQVNINKEIGDHSFNLLGLQSIYIDRTEVSEFASTDQPFETGFYNIGSGDMATHNINNYFRQAQLASFAVRANYTYKDRYLLTVTNRWDGASQLAEGHKWNAFPSAALAWRVSNENFMKGVDKISDLKLRVSYGTTGNQNISPYSTSNTLDVQTYYDFDGSAANGWVASSIANKALTWEKTKELNLGVDYDLFSHRIRGSIDWYDRLSDGLLVQQKLPFESGFESIAANSASVRNTGVELMLTTTNVQSRLVTWETIFTFTKNTNSIESLYGQSENDDVGNGWFIGESIDSHYNYQFDGIWQPGQVDEASAYNQEPGQAKVKDINGDGEISPEDDRVILGSSNPDWTAGIISRLNVGNFDLNLTISAVEGVLAYSNFHANFEDVRDRGRQKLDIADWYVPENTAGIQAQYSNSYPQPRNAGTYWRNDGVGYYKDASFIKVNNISLGYSLPSNALSRLKLQSMRVYVNVLNPFVMTDYTGWDPEWAEASFSVGRVSNITTQIGMSLKF